MVLFRYFEKKDNLPDPNTSALKELAIPVAIAALYNTSVFYPVLKHHSFVSFSSQVTKQHV